jgi:murein DD-endopeptidase MepM/ murein hydrolase activator NlpD
MNVPCAKIYYLSLVFTLLCGCMFQTAAKVKTPAPRFVSDPKIIQPHPKPMVKVAAKKPIEKFVWLWPAKGKVVRLHKHEAVNIIGTRGQPVFASASGKVVYVQKNAMHMGGVVIIKHEKAYTSLYAHLDALAVSNRQTIHVGQKIGEMHKFKRKQGMVYFMVLRKDHSINPYWVLKKRA